MQLFVKHADTPHGAAAEAVGLCWLRAATELAVEVHQVDEAANTLTITRVEPAPATPAAARTAGRELARMHDAGAPAFGSPPPGWQGPTYIGRQRQDCRPTDSWARFYAEQRVVPFAREAARIGNLSARDLAVVEQCLAALDEADNAGGGRDNAWLREPPARIHGDLWAGNLLYGAAGPAIIDPAAHGGHRETDLAMLALFGTPYLAELIAGYQEIHLLSPGWRRRVPLHQLHPLAVHAVSHGPSYGRELGRAATQALAELRRG